MTEITVATAHVGVSNKDLSLVKYSTISSFKSMITELILFLCIWHFQHPHETEKKNQKPNCHLLDSNAELVSGHQWHTD